MAGIVRGATAGVVLTRTGATLELPGWPGTPRWPPPRAWEHCRVGLEPLPFMQWFSVSVWFVAVDGSVAVVAMRLGQREGSNVGREQ